MQCRLAAGVALVADHRDDLGPELGPDLQYTGNTPPQHQRHTTRPLLRCWHVPRGEARRRKLTPGPGEGAHTGSTEWTGLQCRLADPFPYPVQQRPHRLDVAEAALTPQQLPQLAGEVLLRAEVPALAPAAVVRGRRHRPAVSVVRRDRVPRQLLQRKGQRKWWVGSAGRSGSTGALRGTQPWGRVLFVGASPEQAPEHGSQVE